MTDRFNELILVAGDKKKKGGSLGAVFKLIQDLTDFEEKIQDCIDSQEIVQNKEVIESFLKDIDKMYESLLNIAKGGIQSLRSERAIQVDDVEEVEEVEESEESEVQAGHGSLMLEDEVRERGRQELSRVKKPIVPKM